MTLASCVDDPIDSGGKVENPAKVILDLRCPGDFLTYATRAADENDVSDLRVLMFDAHDQLIAISTATMTARNAYLVAPPANSEGVEIKFVLLANAGQIIANSIGFDPTDPNFPSDDYATLMPLISAAITGPMFTTANSKIPMWGETSLVTITGGVQHESVTLMRAVARIDVGVGRYTKGSDGSFTWNGLTAATDDPQAQPIPFQMTAVYAVKPNNKFSVAPVLSNVSFSGVNGDPEAIMPSVPPGTEAFDTFRDQPTENLFRFEVDGNLNYTTRNIYLPESDIRTGGANRHRDRMALVVAGRFDQDAAETYYRVDFGDGDLLQDVLRNHLYTFSIVNVIGSGYPTVEAAYNAQAMNMTVDVLDWDQGVINNIWFEGVNYFAMDRTQVMFNPMPGETLSINLRTNIPSFYFSHADDPNAQVRLAINYPGQGDNVLFFDGAQRYGYQFTLSKVDSPMADDNYVLQIYNPRDNIGENPAEDRSIDWIIHALNLEMRFNVDQRHSQGDISLEDGQGRFLPPEGSVNHPIPVEIYSFNPVEITATEVVNGVSRPAAWIDLGDTSMLQQGSGRDFFFYKNDLVVAPFRYGEELDGTTDRTATINIYIPATNANVNYNITQQAPYVRIDRETVSAARPLTGSGSETLPVYVYTNIKPGDLIVSKADGGDSHINFLGDGTLEQYDPRSPGNRRFTVGVIYDPNIETSYSATFVVRDRNGTYGNMPDESIRVVVPPVNQTFDMFWNGAVFQGAGVVWQPTAMTDPLGSSNYVFPWNTTSVSFDAVSNIGFVPDPDHTSQADIDRLSLSGPTNYNTAGTLLYRYTYTPEKSSYSATSSHRLAFTSTLQPDLVTGEVNFKLGLQVFQVGGNAYGSRRFTYAGVGQAAPGVVDITANIGWRVDVDAGSWFKLRAENSSGTNTGNFAAGGFYEMDDRVYAPVSLTPDAPAYENNSTSVLVNNTELQFTIDALNFYNPHDPSPEPESRTATITIRNNDYTAQRLGAANPAPIVITQYNRVLRSEGIPANLPPTNMPLTLDHTAQVYTFNARTNLDPVWLDVWEVDASGNKVGTDPLTRVVHPTGFDPSNAAAPVMISPVRLPDAGTMSRKVLIALSSPGLTNTQEQRLGIWTQASAYPHSIVTWRDGSYLAPPGVLGVGAETGLLTLKGSKEFDNALARAIGFEKTADETVYVVMFKRGSLIGLKTKGAAYNAATDVIWAPFDYDLTTLGTTWASISNVATGTAYPTSRTSTLIGDPCAFADGHDGDGANRWMTPTGGTGGANGYGYWNGPNGIINGVAPYSTVALRGQNSGLTTNPSLYLLTFVADQNVVVPYVGQRDANGAFAVNTYDNPQLGNNPFWINGGTGNTGLNFSGAAGSDAYFSVTTLTNNIAAPIRCVPK